MVSDNGQYLLPSLLVNLSLLPLIGIIRKPLPHVSPYQWIRLYVQRARVPVLVPPHGPFLSRVALVCFFRIFRKRLLIIRSIWLFFGFVFLNRRVLNIRHPLTDLVGDATARGMAVSFVGVGILDVVLVVDDGVECGVVGVWEVVFGFFDVEGAFR